MKIKGGEKVSFCQIFGVAKRGEKKKKGQFSVHKGKGKRGRLSNILQWEDGLCRKDDVGSLESESLVRRYDYVKKMLQTILQIHSRAK